jgi:hypothetical protein
MRILKLISCNINDDNLHTIVQAFKEGTHMIKTINVSKNQLTSKCGNDIKEVLI